MDRDQRSRQQKAAPPRRSMGSRVGLQKKGQAPDQRKAGSRPPRASQTQSPPPRRTTGQQTRRPVQNNPQKPGYRPAPAKNRRVTKAEIIRRRNRRRLAGALAVLAVLAVGVVLSVNLLFKVTGYRVENMDGSTPANTGIYTEAQLVELLGVPEGENLFGFSTREKQQMLAQALPYLEDVSVELSLPGTIVIKVDPAVERFAVQSGNDWLVVSQRLKVLRTDSEMPDGLILLEAQLSAEGSTVPGSRLRLESGEEFETGLQTGENASSAADETLISLLQLLYDNELLDGTTMISVADLAQINVLYQGRISIKIGTANNMDYKVRLASRAILDPDKGLSGSDRGTLDVSYQFEDGEIRAYFQPASAEPEPAPEPEPDGEPTE